MQYPRVAAFLAGIALAGGLTTMPVVATETQRPKERAQDDIWQDEARPPRSWWNRGLSEETIDRALEDLRKRDRAAARRLAGLRKRDPEQFRIELRELARPEIEQIIREYWESRRQRRNTEFLDWLKASYPKEHERLAKLKERDPPLYVKSFEHMMDVYGPIFEAERSNPELGAVLKEDFDLKKRRDELREQLRCEKSDAKKQALGVELQEVVARRYDLIVRQKEIAYEQLLKKLEELHQQVRDSKQEIAKYKDPRLKEENVRQRVRALTENKAKFKWD